LHGLKPSLAYVRKVKNNTNSAASKMPSIIPAAKEAQFIPVYSFGVEINFVMLSGWVSVIISEG
jgi:hypothetical protein